MMDNKAKEELLRAAFAFENDQAPYIIYDANYWLYGEVQDKIPLDYCSEDPTSMFNYQMAKIEKHLEMYDDAYIPFLMPWYGTGVLGSGFGVEIKFNDYMDPTAYLPIIDKVEQLKDLKRPDPEKDGLMPRTLNAIRYMRANSDLPVGVTDCQGPLTTALQVIGYDKMSYWMYDHPNELHEFMDMVTDVLIEWVKLQKKLAGQKLDDDAYVLGTKVPTGYGGVWFSDDDSIIFGTDLYKEFIVPYNSKMLKAFGGGSIHYCGNANQHIDNYLATEGLTAIQNFNLDDLDGATKMRNALAEKGIAYITADFNVADDYIDEYYETLFKKMGTKGLIVVPYIAPAIMLKGGKYIENRCDPDEVGRMIDKAINKYNKP